MNDEAPLRPFKRRAFSKASAPSSALHFRALFSRAFPPSFSLGDSGSLSFLVFFFLIEKESNIRSFWIKEEEEKEEEEEEEEEV